MAVGIKGELCRIMKTVLQAACIDDIDAADDALVGLVMLGKYQASITVKKIVIEVHPQHPLGPERQERKSGQADVQRDGYEWNLPPETIGGARFRWYRGTVQIRYHLKMDREEALAIIQVVVERVRQALETNASLIGITDDFGNRIHALEVTDDYSYTNEAGDPATERVFVDWRALVSSRRTRV
jgi:hypothetical protein